MSERKVTLVTGAASGIGLETVKRFSADFRYSSIFAVDKNPHVLTTFLEKQFPQVIPLQVDLRSDRQIDDMIDRIVSDAGRVDVVINAAGVIIAGRDRSHYLYHQDPAIKKQMMNLWWTNEVAVYHVMGKVEEIMRRNGGGTIINVTSSKDYFPDPYRMEYMRGKQRVEETSMYEAKELEKDNIRVVAVKPGNTRTDIDRGVWVRGSNEKEAESVQGFNDWWRRTFGNDPRNVAELIYEIAEGRIRGSRVHVGFDAKLGYFLSRTVPFWRQIFYAGSYCVYEIIKLGKPNASPVSIRGSNEGVLNDWYEEIMAERPRSRTPEVVIIGDQDFYRLCQGVSVSAVQLQELGVTFEELDAYLSSKLARLEGHTRLIERCEPQIDGDWQYHYVTEQQQDSNLIFGRESVIVRGEEVFDRYLVFSPVM